MTVYTLTGGQTVNASGDPVGNADEWHISGSGNLAIGHNGVDYWSVDGLDNTIQGGGGGDAGYFNLSSATVAFHTAMDAAGTVDGLTLADGTHISRVPYMSALFGSGDDVVTTGSTFTCYLFGGGGDDNLSSTHLGSELSGQAGSDTLTGGPGNDTMFGYMATFTGFDYGVDDGTGHDVLHGGGGDDSLTGSLGSDTLFGAAGSDTVSFKNVFGSVGVSVHLGDHGRSGGAAGKDVLRSVENAHGSGAADIIVGDEGINTINGAAGADTITGGGGADVLDGGPFDAAADSFKYRATADSAPTASDTINDFEHGVDRIDLRAIDADGDASNGDSAFRRVDAFDGQKGELVFSFHDGAGSFSVDVDGDGQGDMTVYVNGDGLSRADFAV